MIVVQADASVSSEVPDIQEVPFDADVNIDASEYARIMRGISCQDGDSGASAGFNSSI